MARHASAACFSLIAPGAVARVVAAGSMARGNGQMGRCGSRTYRPIQVCVNLVGGKSPSGDPAGRLRGSQLRVQVSDHLSGDFKEQDEVNVVRLASLTSAALDTRVQLHLPDYRARIAP